jgi:hypothetical protein
MNSGAKMKKAAGVSFALLLLSSAMSPALALMLPVAPVTPASTIASGGSAGLGAWIAGGVIGVAAFLGLYDFGRRTTCVGDPLLLGGPGFSEPMPGAGNVMPPQCKVAAFKGMRHRP